MSHAHRLSVGAGADPVLGSQPADDSMHSLEPATTSHQAHSNCRSLAFCDVTVSIERLETTIMYHVGSFREANITVLKLQIFTL